MQVVAIEINDVGLRASVSTGAVGRPLGEPSPGYALLERRDLVTGEPARAAARLKPRFVSRSHWDQMDLEAVGRPFPVGLRNADLVHAHLSALWSEIATTLEGAPGVLLVVPPSYQAQQLGLLLGIARSCTIPVTGMVDAGLASMAAQESPGAIIHVDTLLHRAAATRLVVNGSLRRDAIEIVGDAGLLEFQRLWSELVAARFVRETRFDPLHRGESEQALFDRLSPWAEQAATGGTAIAELGGHSIEIGAAELRSASSGPLEAIVEGVGRLGANASAVIALSSRCAALPGLADRLREAFGQEPLRLAGDAATAGAISHRQAIEAPGEQMPLVLELPEGTARG